VPARDLYHDAVKNALIKDGWTITDDPLRLSFGLHKVYIDLGAERILAAEKGNEKIAVEVKTFLGHSEMRDFELALGQFVFYRSLLARTDADRALYLAVPEEIALTLFTEQIARVALLDIAVKVMAFDPEREVIASWTS
jgi:hypothetical protein